MIRNQLSENQCELLVEKVNNDNLFPDYEILNCIGRGSSASVYDTRYQNNIERVAKIIGAGESSYYLGTKGSNEYIIQSKLNSSNIVKVYDYKNLYVKFNKNEILIKDDVEEDEHKQYIYIQFIFMEKVEPVLLNDGQTLISALSKYSVDEFYRFAQDIGSAISIAHKNSIMHRDIKFENIFYDDEQKKYKLSDFGVAKESKGQGFKTLIGTPIYLAPEVLATKPYTYTADIYSYGIVLYFLLNSEIKELDWEEKKALSEPSNGSEMLKKIVMKACAYKAEDRYSNIDDLLKDLEVCYTEDKNEQQRENQEKVKKRITLGPQDDFAVLDTDKEKKEIQESVQILKEDKEETDIEEAKQMTEQSVESFMEELVSEKCSEFELNRSLMFWVRVTGVPGIVMLFMTFLYIQLQFGDSGLPKLYWIETLLYVPLSILVGSLNRTKYLKKMEYDGNKRSYSRHNLRVDFEIRKLRKQLSLLILLPMAWGVLRCGGLNWVIHLLFPVAMVAPTWGLLVIANAVSIFATLVNYNLIDISSMYIDKSYGWIFLILGFVGTVLIRHTRFVSIAECERSLKAAISDYIHKNWHRFARDSRTSVKCYTEYYIMCDWTLALILVLIIVSFIVAIIIQFLPDNAVINTLQDLHLIRCGLISIVLWFMYGHVWINNSIYLPKYGNEK